MVRGPRGSPRIDALFPYQTLFRSVDNSPQGALTGTSTTACRWAARCANPGLSSKALHESGQDAIICGSPGIFGWAFHWTSPADAGPINRHGQDGKRGDPAAHVSSKHYLKDFQCPRSRPIGALPSASARPPQASTSAATTTVAISTPRDRTSGVKGTRGTERVNPG